METLDTLKQKQDGWLSLAQRCGMSWAVRTNEGGLKTNVTTNCASFEQFSASLATEIHVVLRRSDVLLWKEESDAASEVRSMLPTLLTQREREVVEELLEGKTSSEIAQSMELSPRTVEKHLERIRSKLGVHDNRALFSIFST